MSRLEELMEELDAYLNVAVVARGEKATGPGTIKGFHAKVAEVFQLGRSVGYDEALPESPGDPAEGLNKRLLLHIAELAKVIQQDVAEVAELAEGKVRAKSPSSTAQLHPHAL